MKAKLIIINWCLSFVGLCIDTEHSPFWSVLMVAVWFVLASILLKYADQQGWLKEFVKRYKLNE